MLVYRDSWCAKREHDASGCLRSIFTDGEPQVLQRPGVYDTASPVLKRLIEQTPSIPQDSAYFRTFALAMAERVGNYQDARALLDAANGQVDPEGLERLGTRSEDATGRVYAFTGPQATAVLAADRLV
jgi:hypothetical protein